MHCMASSIMVSSVGYVHQGASTGLPSWTVGANGCEPLFLGHFLPQGQCDKKFASLQGGLW